MACFLSASVVLFFRRWTRAFTVDSAGCGFVVWACANSCLVAVQMLITRHRRYDVIDPPLNDIALNGERFQYNWSPYCLLTAGFVFPAMFFFRKWMREGCIGMQVLLTSRLAAARAAAHRFSSAQPLQQPESHTVEMPLVHVS